MTSHEMGAAPEAAWGADDREVTLQLSGDALTRLAFAMLCEQLQGRADGFEQLLALSERHGLEPRLACWT